MKKQIAFATCVQLGLSCIEEIYRIGSRLDLLITLEDDLAVNKSGRIYLDDTSNKYCVPLLKVKNINQLEVIQKIKELRIDWLFIIGWSQIAKSEVLNAPKKGCIGMHPTLLPEGRGRASVPWAILKGLKKTGVTMFKLDEGIDTGDIIAQNIIEIGPKITATELYKSVNEQHIKLISKYWDDILGDRLELTKQRISEASVWPERKQEDGEIFSSMTMDEADKLVRAVTHPYPGAFYKDGDKTIRIWSAIFSANDGTIKLNNGYMTPIDFYIEEHK